MSLPKVPSSFSEAAWKKAAGKQHAALEKEHKVGAALDEMTGLVSDKDLKALDELEDAVKASEGGEIVKLYQRVNVSVESITKLQRRAKEFEREAKSIGAELKKDKETKSIGEWLIDAAAAAVSYADALDDHATKLLDKAEKVPLEKIVDLDWDLNEWDLTHLLTKVLSIDLQSIALPDSKLVKVTVTGQIGAEGAKNAALRAEFFEASYAAGKALGPALKKLLESIDEQFRSGKLKAADVPKAMASAFAAFESDYEKKADEAIQKIWANLQKDKKEYRSYKIKTVVSIGAKIGGIAVGVASLAGAGWTGAGTVIGIIALVKSSVELVGKISDGLKEARTLGVEINEALADLKAAFAKDSAALTGTKEVAKEVLTRLTGIRTKTVNAVGNSIGLYSSKLQGCNANASDLGSKIDQLLREADALSAKIRRAEDALQRVKGVDIGKLRKKHEQLMVQVGRIVTIAADYKEDYKKGQVALTTWKDQLDDLKGDVPAVAKLLIKWAVPVLDFAYVTSAEGAITATGALARELLIVATETESDLNEANAVGSVAGDVAILITGMVGK